MTRRARALQNAGLAVAVLLGFVIAVTLVFQLMGAALSLTEWLGEVFPAALFAALLYGAPSIFLLDLVFDPIAARLHRRVSQRLLAIVPLLGVAVAVSLAFEDYLAPTTSEHSSAGLLSRRP